MERSREQGELAARLRRMRAEGAVVVKGQRHSGDGPASQAQTALSRKESPGERLSPGWERINEFLWKRRTVLQAACPRRLPASPLLPSGGIAEDFVFYDVETTGLSGGAGTVAFLAGLGVSDGKRLTIDQFFLADYPGEPGFLASLLASMNPEKTYVSYNGKAFDTQILRIRCIMNGHRLPLSKQLDLLYPVRRLYGASLPSCSLSNVEEYVLRERRGADIPGALIPEVYFQFLKNGKPQSLEVVFSHHLQDIVSLERLLARISQVLTDPDGDDCADRCGLGRWLVDSGFPGGLDVLTRAFEAGDSMAGYHLGRYMKRRRDFESAASVWTAMFERSMDLHAAFELSKYAEHRLRDYTLAENYASLILAAVSESPNMKSPETKEALRHRLERIRIKRSRE